MMINAQMRKLQLAAHPRMLEEFSLGFGYAFVLAQGRLWTFSAAEDWELVLCVADAVSTCVGALRIDGERCLVFLCSDGAYRAQPLAYLHSTEVQS